MLIMPKRGCTVSRIIDFSEGMNFLTSFLLQHVFYIIEFWNANCLLPDHVKANWSFIGCQYCKTAWKYCCFIKMVIKYGFMILLNTVINILQIFPSLFSWLSRTVCQYCSILLSVEWFSLVLCELFFLFSFKTIIADCYANSHFSLGQYLGSPPWL